MHQGSIISRVRPVEKAAILHLGTIKTGTTYIQSLARQNARRLADQGVIYPAYDDSPAHHLFAQQFGEATPSETIFDQHISAGAGQHLLLSSEIFISYPSHNLEQLRSLFLHHLPFAVVYFREPTGFLRSWVQEAIKHGWSGAFSGSVYPDRLTKLARNPYSHVMLQSVEVGQKVMDVFGPDRTVFVAFDNIVESRSDLFSHLLSEVIGIDNAFIDYTTATKNSSIDFKTQETARLFHTIVNLRGRKSDIGYFQFLLENIDEFFSDFPEFDSLEKYRHYVSSNSREGGNGEMERELFQRFEKQFLNAHGEGIIYECEYDRQVEWADLLAFSNDNLRAFEGLERLADKAIARRSDAPM